MLAPAVQKALEEDGEAAINDLNNDSSDSDKLRTWE